MTVERRNETDRVTRLHSIISLALRAETLPFDPVADIDQRNPLLRVAALANDDS
jgi:hypothetical protein